MTPNAPLTPLNLAPTALANGAVRLSAATNSGRPTATSELLGQLPSQRQAQLSALATKVEAENTRTLLDVLVKDQRPATPAIRQLLQQVLQTSPLLSSHSPRDGNKGIQTLLQSKHLYLIKLLAEGKAQWALSEKPLPADKPLIVTVDGNKQWHVSDKTSVSKPTTILRQSVRDNLPRAIDLASAFRVLQTFTQQQAIPRELVPVLNQLLRASPKPEHLSQASGLKHAIKHSGVLWENNIRQALHGRVDRENKFVSSNPTLSHSPTTIAPTQRTHLGNQASAFDKILRQLLALRTTAAATSVKPSPLLVNNHRTETVLPLSKNSTAGNNTDKTVSPDLKAQLLLVKHIIQTLLKPASQPLNKLAKPTVHHADIKSPASESKQKNSTKTVNTEVRHQVIQRIQQQVIATLAKIQLQQSQSLLQQSHASGDGQRSLNTLQLEIPVQLHGDYHNLRLQLEEDWVERRKQNQESKKARRWRVSLCIELPNAGRFYACVTHVNNETDVQLWAEQSATARQVRDTMSILQQRLQQQGVNVSALRCEQGIPADTKISNQLTCALVDVRT